MPPPRATSTPATTGVDSTLRATTPWRFSKFKIRRRGDFSLPHLRRAKLTHRAGQVCRLFLSPKKNTCAAGTLVTTSCYVRGPEHGVERSTLTTLTRRGNPLRRLSYLLYYCSVCCLPPASCRPEQDTPIVAAPDRTMSPTRCGPEQDTPILALPLRRRRRCTRIAFGCAQDIRTINECRLYYLPTTTRGYFIWCQHTVLCCTNRVKEKRACKEGSRQKVLHRQCQQYHQFQNPPVLL